jgi:hypothetical protein
MPTAPFWDSDPDSWDRVILGGLTLPGLCKVEGLKSPARWDIKEAPGTDGATETYKGYTPASLTIRVTIWTEEQWMTIQPMIEALRPRPGKQTPKPFDIVHPATAARGIRSVIVMDVEGPEDSSDVAGAKEFVIPCREYFAQPKKNTTGTASGSAAANPARVDKGDGMNRPPEPVGESDRPLASKRPVVPDGAIATENGIIDVDALKKSYAE